jgi:hypothetical protein
MALMRGAGTVILVSRARGQRAIGRGNSGAACAKAVYEEREYRDD